MEKRKSTYQGKTIETMADLSLETMKARRQQNTTFQVPKETINPEFYIQENILQK